MFNYLDTCTWQEKAAISDELKALYNTVLRNEQESFSYRLEDKISAAAYDGRIYALGILQAAFEALHIPYEEGRLFCIGEEATA